MSREHVDAVRGVYEGFARGDFSASLGLYDPDVVFIHHLESAEKTVWGSDLAGTYHGLSGLGEYMRNLLEVWSEVTIDAEELVEVGDTVVATIGMQAVGRTAGVSGKIRFFHVWTFRGPEGHPSGRDARARAGARSCRSALARRPLRAKSSRATNIPHRGRDPVLAVRKGRRTDRHVWTGCDARGITSDELDPPLARRALTAGERKARERGREIDAALEPIVRPRIAAHISACRQALDVIEAELDRMSETLSIEPAASTRASALWLLLGRCVGQQRAVLLLAEHGMAVEGRPLDRTIKEMTNLVKAIGADGPVAEKLARQWLSDRESYVKPQAGRRGTVAAFKNTEKEAEAFRHLGLESLDEADRAVFNDLGLAAHGRRSSMLESYYAPTRQMARGAHFPLLDQAIAVEWASVTTNRVILARPRCCSGSTDSNASRARCCAS